MNPAKPLQVWADSGQASADGKPLIEDDPSTDTLIAEHQPVRAQDLDPLRQKLELGVNRFCELLGITPVTWYAWRRNPEAPISSRSVALHMRLLDAFPELARLGAQPLDLQEALRAQRGIDLTFTELALLLGVERRAGYAWSRGYAASESVQALTASLLYLVLHKSRQDWERYQRLLAHQAMQEGVDLKTTKSWSTGGIQAGPDASDSVPARSGRGRPFRRQTPTSGPGSTEGTPSPDTTPAQVPKKKPGRPRH